MDDPTKNPERADRFVWDDDDFTFGDDSDDEQTDEATSEEKPASDEAQDSDGVDRAAKLRRNGE